MEAQIDIAEAVQLSAADSEFYGRFFFPKTCRQQSPQFHREMDKRLDGNSRYVSFMIFRDGAKTTKTRLYLSKRIAYGLSRTIILVGKSQSHAVFSIAWIKSTNFSSCLDIL